MDLTLKLTPKMVDDNFWALELADDSVNTRRKMAMILSPAKYADFKPLQELSSVLIFSLRYIVNFSLIE